MYISFRLAKKKINKFRDFKMFIKCFLIMPEKNVQFQQTTLFLSFVYIFFDQSPVVSSLLKRRIVNHHPDEQVPDPGIRILLHHIEEVVEILKPALQPYIVNQALQGSQSRIYNIYSPSFFQFFFYRIIKKFTLKPQI